MLRVIQISDCHLSVNKNFEKHGVNTWQAFQSVLVEISHQAKPDLIIASGDIADEPSAQLYQEFFAALKPFSCPIVCVPGNHDDKNLMGSLLKPYVDLGAWQVIGLDSNGPARQEYGGSLPECELLFLEKKLQASYKPSLIVLHHPALVTGHGWLQSVKLENTEQLLSLLTNYPQVKAISFGHVHYAYDSKDQGIWYLSNPSTYRQFAGEAMEFAIAKTSRPGYRRLCLMNNGELITEPCFIP